MVFFEAPIAHGATQHGNPYTHTEFEEEWEASPPHHFQHNPYVQGEFEEEWEAPPGSHHYSGPAAYSSGVGEFEEEWEAPPGSHHYSGPAAYSSGVGEFEDEWEVPPGSHHYSGPAAYSSGVGEFEDEWEVPPGSPYTHTEFEDESEFLGNILRGVGGLFGGEEGEMEFEDASDRFFGKLRGLIGRIKRRVSGLARRALSIVPGVTRVISSIASESHPGADRMLNALAQEAEMEVTRVENHFTDKFAQTGEAEHPAVHAAFLSELMAANAAAAQSEAEAEAILGATIPLTIRLMRAQRTLLPVTPSLVQANVRLVRTLRRQGRDGRQLLRLLPTIHRNTVEILRLLARQQRLTTPLAVRAMGVATRRVMSNPRRTERALQRNIALQIRATRTNRPRGSLPLRPTPRRQRVAV